MEHRPQPAVILVADRMEDQSLARVEADAEAPFLPAHFITLDREARTVRLHDLERLHVVPEDVTKRAA